MFAPWLAIFVLIDLAECKTHQRHPVHGSGQWQVVAPHLAGARDQGQFPLLLFSHTVKTNFGFPGGCVEWPLLAAATEKQHCSKEPGANREPRDTRSNHFAARYLIPRNPRSLSTNVVSNARAHFEFDNELALGRYRRCDLAIGQSRQASILRKRHYQQLGKSPAA